MTSMLVAAAGLGTVLGLGLWLVAGGLVPAPPRLGEVLARLGTQTVPAPIPGNLDAGWVAKAGRPFTRPLHALGLPAKGMRSDLAIVGTTEQAHLATKATWTLAGLLTPCLAYFLAAGIGSSPPLALFLLAGVAFAVIGFLAPDIRVRRQAAGRRDDFRHALSAYLDMVVVSLAGGAGVDQALHDSATVGTGWAFARLRQALDTARLTRVTPWTALRRLGDELAVTELAELAASVSLAGTEGAKVRASLAAKAEAVRTRQLNEAEGREQSATERMSLPVTLLFLGFLVFIGFPAIQKIISAL